jgi:Fe2+ transport system protein FeoA
MQGRRHKHQHGICCRGPEGPCIPLASIKVSQEAVITSFDALNGEASRLRDLGIREGSRVRIILSGPNQMIVAVDQARVGLPRNVADLVLVRQVTPA